MRVYSFLGFAKRNLFAGLLGLSFAAAAPASAATLLNVQVTSGSVITISGTTGFPSVNATVGSMAGVDLQSFFATSIFRGGSLSSSTLVGGTNDVPLNFFLTSTSLNLDNDGSDLNPYVFQDDTAAFSGSVTFNTGAPRSILPNPGDTGHIVLADGSGQVIGEWEATPVPLPAGLPLLAAGLGSMLWIGKRRRKHQS